MLTLHRDYFRLRKPLERRMYELARKHCGRQAEWSIGLDCLRQKCGSSSSLKEFRRVVRAICDQDEAHAHMPDYAVVMAAMKDGSDKVVFRNRQILAPATYEPTLPPLPSTAHEDARAAASGWDIYMLEQEWRAWCAKKDVVPRALVQHFVSFCSTWAGRRGRP